MSTPGFRSMLANQLDATMMTTIVAVSLSGGIIATLTNAYTDAAMLMGAVAVAFLLPMSVPVVVSTCSARRVRRAGGRARNQVAVTLSVLMLGVAGWFTGTAAAPLARSEAAPNAPTHLALLLVPSAAAGVMAAVAHRRALRLLRALDNKESA